MLTVNLKLLIILLWLGILSGFVNRLKSDDAFPITKGKLVFHSYSSYSSGDGKLFIYYFGTDSLAEISKNWNLQHTINAHFSPDGKKIVFMAQPKGQSNYNAWNIYLWDLNSKEEPQNLTPNNNIPDEDPKFFPDGNRVVFKQNGDIKIIDIDSRNISDVTSDGFAEEESMPYPTTDGEHIVFAKNGKIYMIDTDGNNLNVLTSENNVGCYYPIVKDDSSYLYPRWVSSLNHHDDIFLGSLQKNSASVSCPFNKINDDDSDPFPVPNTNYVFFSSNRSGGQGDWDIYLGDIKTGQVWSLSFAGVNSAKMELGSSYYADITTAIMQATTPKQEMKGKIYNYPNPFNPITTIHYTVNGEGYKNTAVKVLIYNVRGQLISTLVDQSRKPGVYEAVYRAGHLPSGVYYYVLIENGRRFSGKMLLIR